MTKLSDPSSLRGLLVLAVLATAGCEKEPPPPEPEISQECTLNGMGQGECSFTNTGSVKGAVCGHVELVKCPDPSVYKCKVEKKDENGEVVREEDNSVVRVPGETEKVETSVFCSGQLEPATTAKVEYSVQSPMEFCTTPTSRIIDYGSSEKTPWNEICSFKFVAKNTVAAQDEQES